jgi:hypothetical protein
MRDLISRDSRLQQSMMGTNDALLDIMRFAIYVCADFYCAIHKLNLICFNLV